MRSKACAVKLERTGFQFLIEHDALKNGRKVAVQLRTLSNRHIFVAAESAYGKRIPKQDIGNRIQVHRMSAYAAILFRFFNIYGT